MLFLDVVYCFPTALPVTGRNMSYVSVVVGGLTGFVVLLWFGGKRGVFVGPRINMVVLEERRMAALGGVVVRKGVK